MKTDTNDKAKKTSELPLTDKKKSVNGFGSFLKKLNQPVGTKKAKKQRDIRQLWGREFDIVERGLDENQVVSFVNELVAKYETSHMPVKTEGYPTTEPSAEKKPVPETSSGQAFEKACKRSGFMPLQHGNRMLYSGEVELEIESPVDPKMVVKIFNYFQTVPEIKILHTRGSWEQNPIITVTLDKPTPLISLIADIQGIEGGFFLSEEDEADETTKKGLLSGRKKGTARKISLVLAEK